MNLYGGNQGSFPRASNLSSSNLSEKLNVSCLNLRGGGKDPTCLFGTDHGDLGLGLYTSSLAIVFD